MRLKFTNLERRRALEVIAKCDGSLTLAASRLGISVPTLSRWRQAASNGKLICAEEAAGNGRHAVRSLAGERN